MVVLLSMSSTAFAQDRKFVNHTELGLLPYGFKMKESGITVQTLNGYAISPKWTLGGTLGYDKLFVTRGEEVDVFSLSGGVRHTIIQPETTGLYAGLDVGYGFASFRDQVTDRKEEGGLRVAPQVGVKWKLGARGSFTLSLGYHYQKAGSETYQETVPLLPQLMTPGATHNYHATKSIHAHRASLKVGFGF